MVLARSNRDAAERFDALSREKVGEKATSLLTICSQEIHTYQMAHIDDEDADYTPEQREHDRDLTLEDDRLFSAGVGTLERLS